MGGGNTEEGSVGAPSRTHHQRSPRRQAWPCPEGGEEVPVWDTGGLASVPRALGDTQALSGCGVQLAAEVQTDGSHSRGARAQSWAIHDPSPAAVGFLPAHMEVLNTTASS